MPVVQQLAPAEPVITRAELVGYLCLLGVCFLALWIYWLAA
jgi:hypothetical protein